MAARWHRSFSVFAEAESESVLAMRIRDSAFFANSRRLRSPPVIGPSYTYFRVLQRLSTSCKWLQAVVIYALKRPASASILCRTRFWPTFFNWLNLAERNCHDYSPEIGICRSSCFSTYTFRNSRMGEIRLFVLRGLACRFSAAFWNSRETYIRMAVRAMTSMPATIMRRARRKQGGAHGAPDGRWSC